MNELYDEKGKPWNGDKSCIPESGTLVAIETSSRGLVNMRVNGYEVTYHQGKPQIRIKLEVETYTNERFLQDLQVPMTKREKSAWDIVRDGLDN